MVRSDERLIKILNIRCPLAKSKSFLQLLNNRGRSFRTAPGVIAWKCVFTGIEKVMMQYPYRKVSLLLQQIVLVLILLVSGYREGRVKVAESRYRYNT